MDLAFSLLKGDSARTQHCHVTITRHAQLWGSAREGLWRTDPVRAGMAAREGDGEMGNTLTLAGLVTT